MHKNLIDAIPYLSEHSVVVEADGIQIQVRANKRVWTTRFEYDGAVFRLHCMDEVDGYDCQQQTGQFNAAQIADRIDEYLYWIKTRMDLEKDVRISYVICEYGPMREKLAKIVGDAIFVTPSLSSAGMYHDGIVWLVYGTEIPFYAASIADEIRIFEPNLTKWHGFKIRSAR